MHVYLYFRMMAILFTHHWYTYRLRISTYLINYGLFYPIVLTISFGYLQPRTYFNDTTGTLGLVLIAGVLLIMLASLSGDMAYAFLHDKSTKGYVYYLQSIFPYFIIYLSYIVFATCWVSAVISLFFIVSWGTFSLFSTGTVQSIQITKLFIAIILSSCTWVCYHYLASVVLNNVHQISPFWVRITMPLQMLGGMFTPWAIMYAVSPYLGYLALCTPFIYVTEGLRAALLGGSYFLNYTLCMITLTIICFILICVGLHRFKKQIDCVV